MANFIEEYDKELLENISSLRQWIIDYVSHELRLEGYPKVRADDIAKTGRDAPLLYSLTDGPGLYNLLDDMAELSSSMKGFPFRVSLNFSLSDVFPKGMIRPPIKIITHTSSFQFNYDGLDDNELDVLLTHLKTMFDTYPYPCEFYEEMNHLYPSVQLMEFIDNMFKKSRSNQFLIKNKEQPTTVVHITIPAGISGLESLADKDVSWVEVADALGVEYGAGSAHKAVFNKNQAIHDLIPHDDCPYTK